MINENLKNNKNFGSFLADFRFRAEGKKVSSQAELKILQLELWLELAQFGLITATYLSSLVNVVCKRPLAVDCVSGKEVVILL